MPGIDLRGLTKKYATVNALFGEAPTVCAVAVCVVAVRTSVRSQVR